MFGVRAEDSNRERHFANAARRFALDAKMFRCRAAVHVENKNDIAFWEAILKHFRPEDRFHFIAGSRNEYGRETCGVTQCLKYADFLSPDFFICIDSDYRYLLQERKIGSQYFILQTYTYSFENHHCFADGLDDVCSRVTHLKNTVFDFRRFLTEFSHILYDLFIWHLYFQNADPVLFSQFEFDSYIGISHSKTYSLVKDNGARILEELQRKVERKTDYLGRKYPKADLDFVRNKYRKLGVDADHVYFYIRGHNLYNLVLAVCKEVCKAMLRRGRKGKKVTGEMVSELYRRRNSLDYELRKNIKYGAYLPIQKIEQDVQALLGENGTAF